MNHEANNHEDQDPFNIMREICAGLIIFTSFTTGLWWLFTKIAERNGFIM